MMTVHEANMAHLLQQPVFYYNGRDWEEGRVTAVMQTHAFVRYGNDYNAKYTPLEDLDLEMI